MTNVVAGGTNATDEFPIDFYKITSFKPPFGNKNSIVRVDFVGLNFKHVGISNMQMQIFKSSMVHNTLGARFPINVIENTSGHVFMPTFTAIQDFPVTVYPGYTMNFVDFSLPETNPMFVYYDTPRVINLSPRSSPLSGQTIVVNANMFFNTSFLLLKIELDFKRTICNECLSEYGGICTMCEPRCGDGICDTMSETCKPLFLFLTSSLSQSICPEDCGLCEHSGVYVFHVQPKHPNGAIFVNIEGFRPCLSKSSYGAPQ